MLEYMAEGMDAARREREELADEAANGTVIDKSILPYKIGAAEAPVGTGKSYVLLILAFSAWYLYGKRTVISTYTKVLQNQLYTKDLPNFIRMLRDYVAKTGIIEAERVNEWRFGVVKGKSNYMCPLILDKYKETTSKYGDLVFKLPWANSNTVLIGLTKLMAIEQAVMGIRDLDRTGAIFEDDPTYPLLCASPFNCEKARNNHGGECPYANTNCPSLQSRRLTNDLLIVNHKLLEQTFETVTQPKENIIAQNEKEEFKSEKQDLKGIPNVLKAEYYFFNPWLFHLAVSSVSGISLESKTIDETIQRLKEHVVWCVMNMAKYRNCSHKICNKYEDLLTLSICTFQIIKNVYDFNLTEKTRKLVDFYSDVEQVIPFVHQLERELKSDNYV